jgi:hypothetical protein
MNVIRSKRLHCFLAAAFLLFVSTPKATAYYDDVHYGLTYVVARMVGYTPQQAYRIASACVSIDYSKKTEPVQVYGAATGNLLITPDEPPRWRFHAFRNEGMFPTSVGGANPAAEREILKQRIELYNLGFDEQNPGPYLHFYQDELPHRGYTSNGGHWFRQTLLATRIATSLIAAAGLPIGGTTDWLSYRFQASSGDPAVAQGQPDSNTALVFNTHKTLSAIMTRLSKGNIKPRPFPAAGSAEHKILVAGLLAKLREVNPHPESLKLNDDYHTAIVKVLDGMEKIDWDKYDPARREMMMKHVRGPDLVKAYAAVNAALAEAGMTDPLSKDRIVYEFDNAGKLIGEKDGYKVIGSIRIPNAGLLVNARNMDGPEILLKMPSYRAGEPESIIGRARWSGKPYVTFENVPVGTLYLELHAGGRVVARRGVDVNATVVEARFDTSNTTLALSR